MIDDKLLQSFMSDIEFLRTYSSSSAKSPASSVGAKSAEYDPFAELLAKAMGALEADQSQGNANQSSIFNSGLQLIEADKFNTWLNPGNNARNNIGKSVTTDDIDRLFPELANLSSLLGSL